MGLPKAFIFDLDGVIVDTAEFHYQAWRNLALELGVKIDREFNDQLKGVSRIESLEKILRYGGIENRYTSDEKEKLANEKNDEYIRLIQNIKPKDILPNILELIYYLHSKDIKIGLASASLNAKTVVKLLDIEHLFHYIADASKIKNSKPAPDIFEDVAQKLEIKPSECVGIEDSKAGIEAINNAGMFSVGIGNNQILKNAAICFESTQKLDINQLLENFEKWQRDRLFSN